MVASHISPGSRVLDLGCGTGALGRWLQSLCDVVIDGVTFNPVEASLARSSYGLVVVADLETLRLSDHFEHSKYDFVVCADVLEHLRYPEALLREIPDLLTPSGKLLVSIPNAGYAGLVAELMQGRFEYRDEGLLDRTHLRFFTRHTLTSFLSEESWHVQSIEAIRKELPDSEFKTAFDALPPAVSRYLLCTDDALTYQFVAMCSRVPLKEVASFSQPVVQGHALALFSAELFFGSDAGFDEHCNVTARGEIGGRNQVLRFLWEPGFSITASRLRLDPADRPGFLHLHGMKLLTRSHELMWEWKGGQDPDSPLDQGAVPTQEICWHVPGIALPSPMLLLLGDDPWFEIPVPESLVRQACLEGAALEVSLGWPMSADYLISARQADSRRHEWQLLESKHHDLQADHAEMKAKCQQEVNDLRIELGALGNQLLAVEDGREQAEARLRLEAENWHSERRRLVHNEHLLSMQTKVLESQLEQLRNHLSWIENSTVFRVSRPLVKAKMALERLLHRNEAQPSKEVSLLTHQNWLPVDVIVPVYKGLFDTQRCITSVLASKCQTPFRLIVINDARP